MQTNQSRVAILMPILNEEANLKKNLLSITSQTHVNFDVYIQDNASDDNSLKIIKEQAIEDQRIKVFSNSSRMEAHENWLSLAKKVINFKDYKYVSWLAGDDIWLNKYYLEALVSELDKNEDFGAVCPTFQIITQSGELLKIFSVGLKSNSPLIRILSLCKNWDNVHHIYGLYRSELFTNLLNTNSSKFTEYLGSDWWWTYTFLTNQRSGSSSQAIYVKSLEENPPKKNSTIPVRRMKNYLNSLIMCWVPELNHLKRLWLMRGKYHLAAVTIVYFSSKSMKKILLMHKMILIRNVNKIQKSLHEN